MLPFVHKIAFFIFALIAAGFGLWGFYRLSLRIRRGEHATELRFNNLIERVKYAITISLTQERTFKNRPTISTLHSLVFYGFMFYLLVNVIDGLEGFLHFSIHSTNPLGATYNFAADVLSILVLVGVLGLMFRRLFHPSRRDFRFTDKTLLHPLVKSRYILRDSLIVSTFILFHVGSRILGNSAKMVHEANDNQKVYDLFQPFSSLIGYLNFDHFSEAALLDLRVFGFWGALASILAFLAYFPFSKHIHLFMAPLNYALKRPVQSGVLPPMKGLEEAMEADEPKLGAEKLEDLEWPRLLDAYACIQCNRCQDVCPANTTGKALSPAALEINKRMELNVIGAHPSPFTLRRASFEKGGESDKPLLEFAINPESVWACTTCGACMEVCPVQDEQMLDIIDIRRNQVMVQGEFPQQLQTAFRGMERTSNPWGIGRDKRMEWADGLKVPTIDENPSPDVIYWVGCAASYDPGAQKVSRAFVQLLDKAGVNYAVLGKKEACTGDAARRAGNEFLYQQLAQENVETLNQVRPKLIVATCPHCMNAIGNEYKQIGGDYHTIHHTEYLELLVAGGKLPLEQLPDHVTYHDPCYLGRHNDVYDAPRNLISKMAGEVLDLEREREDSFCCGAGGAQFWKEEEEGNDRVSDNRFREIQARLDYAAQNVKTYEETGKVVAVGCPFCKSMLNSTPEKQQRDDIVVKDVAEIMLESMQRATGVYGITADPTTPPPPVRSTATDLPPSVQHAVTISTPVTSTAAFSPSESKPPATPTKRKSWTNQEKTDKSEIQAKTTGTEPATAAPQPQRKKWGAKAKDAPVSNETTEQKVPERKKWGGKDTKTAPDAATQVTAQPSSTASTSPPTRKAWKPKDKQAQPKTEPTEATDTQIQKTAQLDLDLGTTSTAESTSPQSPQETTSKRKQWQPKAKDTKDTTATPQPTHPDPLDLDLKAIPSQKADKNQEPSAQTPIALDLDLKTKVDTETSPPTPKKRPKWSPKAKADPAPTSQNVGEDQSTSTKTTSISTESAKSTRPKWQPKAKQTHQDARAEQLSTQKSQEITPPTTKAAIQQESQPKIEEIVASPSATTSQDKEVKTQLTPNKETQTKTVEKPEQTEATSSTPQPTATPPSQRKKWEPKAKKGSETAGLETSANPQSETTKSSSQQAKTITKTSASTVQTPAQDQATPSDHQALTTPQVTGTTRKKWQPKAKQKNTKSTTDQQPATPVLTSQSAAQTKQPIPTESKQGEEDKAANNLVENKEAEIKTPTTTKAEQNKIDSEIKQQDSKLKTHADSESIPESSSIADTKQKSQTKPKPNKLEDKEHKSEPQTAQQLTSKSPSSNTHSINNKLKNSSSDVADTSLEQAKADTESKPASNTSTSAEAQQTSIPDNKTTDPKQSQQVQSQNKETQQRKPQVTKTQTTETEAKTKSRVFSAQQQPATSATRLVYSAQKAKIRKYETTPEKQKELAEAEAAHKPVTKGHLKWNATSRKRKTKDGEYQTKFEEKRKNQKSRKRKKN